jgi:hypothetical protein
VPEDARLLDGPQRVVRRIAQGQDLALRVKERFAVGSIHERRRGGVVGDQVRKEGSG